MKFFVKFEILIGFCIILTVLSCKYKDDVKKLEIENRPIFQRSTIDALLAGRYDDEFSIGEARNWGDIAIGTLNALDGELVALDGVFYQVKTDGIPTELSDTVKTPFITTDFFSGKDSVEIGGGLNFNELTKMLDDKLKMDHNISAFKIKMSFDSLILRSVPKQTKPYQPLIEVVNAQKIFKRENISGTLVGFKFPEYLEGVNVPGYHFHFLSDDLQIGGHVLNFKTQSGKAWIDSESSFYLSIPQDQSFQSKDLSIDRNEELKKVESDN